MIDDVVVYGDVDMEFVFYEGLVWVFVNGWVEVLGGWYFFLYVVYYIDV